MPNCRKRRRSPGRVSVAWETVAGSRPGMPCPEEGVLPAEQNAEEEAEVDPGLGLLGVYVALSLRPAAGAWERCLGSADAGPLLNAFFGRDAAAGSRPLLVVRPVHGGLALQAGLDVGHDCCPPYPKGLFFLRTKFEQPGPNSLRGAAVCGDLPAAPLGHLAALLSEVRVAVGSPEFPANGTGGGRTSLGRSRD